MNGYMKTYVNLKRVALRTCSAITLAIFFGTVGSPSTQYSFTTTVYLRSMSLPFMLSSSAPKSSTATCRFGSARLRVAALRLRAYLLLLFSLHAEQDFVGLSLLIKEFAGRFFHNSYRIAYGCPLMCIKVVFGFCLPSVRLYIH